MVDARYHTADAEIIRYRSRYTERRSGGPTRPSLLGVQRQGTDAPMCVMVTLYEPHEGFEGVA